MHILVIPMVIVGIFFSIKLMIIGMVFNGLIGYLMFSSWTGKIIKYPVMEQVKDITTPFLIALLMGIIVYLFGIIVSWPLGFVLLFQIVSGGLLTVLLTFILYKDAFLQIKNIIMRKIL
ncbi:MAG TPA: hypothetical protein ENO01_00500 [Candidatus Marinimicrobia bacterium]|nr:hypothetical protein [Candidatus Neomarinimicrobiota bacterium]